MPRPSHLVAKNCNYLHFVLSAVAELPYVRLIEQPVEKFRFRYKSEMMGTHGSILGRNSDRNRKKTYPSIEVNLTNLLVTEFE
jgi:hypothetical protein